MKIVVKIGGSLFDEDLSPLARDVKKLSEEHKTVMVHGGAKIVTEIAEKLGKEQRFVTSPAGFRSRYTDAETAEIYTMVIGGTVNKKLVSTLLKEGVNSLGLSGIDGGLLVAERKSRIKVKEGNKILLIEGDYTGKIVEVNAHLLELLLSEGYVPVIGAVAIGKEGENLNVDGDRAAASVAGAIKADKLIVMTDVPGVLENEKVVERLSRVEAKQIMERVGPGMRRKIFAALEAIHKGVPEVIIASGIEEHPILNALEEKNCTVITNE
ncbi:MAG: [LysW]-aminoadipate/[LysW]-glutamate kinase [Candidatus Freyrarchaeum guaymaensis]|nr:[LysW]-aminoadipate/[LysW]-glutamate kinase [Candidatus Sigynarchaeota archaeon]